VLNKLNECDYEWESDMDPVWINIGDIVVHIFEDTEGIVTVEALPKENCSEENILNSFSVSTVAE